MLTWIKVQAVARFQRSDDVRGLDMILPTAKTAKRHQRQPQIFQLDFGGSTAALTSDPPQFCPA
jgi:hypothetical protein